jgi:sec-independent protein translocase protein TatB
MNFNPEKLLVVGLIAFLVLGPDRLPATARSLGRFVAELRRMSSGFEREVRGALAEPTDAFKAAVGEFRPPDVRRSVRDAISTTLSPPAAKPASGPPDTSGLPMAPDDPSLN